MKIILRILYLVVVFFMMSLIFSAGGPNGMRLSSYAANNLHTDPKDPIHTSQIFSGIQNIYVDPDQSNWINLPVVAGQGRFDFTITFIPFASRLNEYVVQEATGKRLDILWDGFLLWLSEDDSTEEDFTTIILRFGFSNATNPDEIGSTTIALPRQGAGTHTLPNGWEMISYGNNIFIPALESRGYGQDTLVSDMDFDAIAHFNIDSLIITTDTLQNEFIFAATEPNARQPFDILTRFIDGQEANTFEWEGNFIDEEMMFFSRRMANYFEGFTPTIAELEDLAERGLVIFLMPNLSPYWWWYLVIWGLFVLLGLVIPYFWMLRKPIKEAREHRKEVKRRQAIAAEKSQPTNAKKFKTVQEGKRIQQQQSKDE